MLLLLFLLISSVFAHGGCSIEKKKLKGVFEPDNAGGMSGYIDFSYHKPNNSLHGMVSVNLDMTSVDYDAIYAEFPECDGLEKKFKWHLHSAWRNTEKSGFIEKCYPQVTSGHYDPTFACGPASQYKDDTVCIEINKQQSYNCNPENYKTDKIECEMGDFSGKYGELKIVDNKIVNVYHDDFFPQLSLFDKPMYNVDTVHWNVLLHLSCPARGNPRVFCTRLELV